MNKSHPSESQGEQFNNQEGLQTVYADSDMTIIQNYQPQKNYNSEATTIQNPLYGIALESEATIIQDYKPRKKRDTEATIIQSKKEIVQDDYFPAEDSTLINYFAQGETQLLSNYNLRMEYSCNATQLLTRKGELIGILKPLEEACPALIKYDSEYWEQIHNILLKNGFIPFGSSEQQQGFFEYQKHEIPEGYKIQYTEARILWKTWWPLQKNRNNYEIQLDFLIFAGNKWYSVQEILCTDGIFYIKTLIGEIILGHADKVVWLEKTIGQSLPQKNTNQFTSSGKSSNGEQKNEKPESDRAIIQKNKAVISASSPPAAPAKTIAPSVKEDDVLEQKLKQLKVKAYQTLANYLVNGEVETRTELIKDAKGEVTSTKVTTIKKNCPQWVVELLVSDGVALSPMTSKVG